MFVTCVTTWPSDSGLQTRLELRQQRRRVSSQLKDPASSYLTLPARFFFLSTPRFHYALCRAQHPFGSPCHPSHQTPPQFAQRKCHPPFPCVDLSCNFHRVCFLTSAQIRRKLVIVGDGQLSTIANDPSLTNSYRCLRKDFATAYIYLSRIPEGICESPPPNFTRFHSLSPKQPS